MRIRRNLLVLVVLGCGLSLALHSLQRNRPEDLPWTRLDLTAPIGLFTGTKLKALAEDAPFCRALLTQAGVSFTALPSLNAGPSCGYENGVRLTPGRDQIGYRPAGLGLSCPLAAALNLWQWEVVQRAAVRHFGQAVAEIEHFGSYNCRRLYGRASGDYSQHARANAVDVAGFRLADGTRLSVARDWTGQGAKAAFLHEVRDGACGLFGTVLSPDYNAAHADHFHLDMARWRVCR